MKMAWMKTGSVWAAAALATMVAIPCQAQTLADKDEIAKDNQFLSTYQKQVNTSCGGTHIQFTINYPSFVHSPGGLQNGSQTNPSGLIQNAGDAITNICRTEAGKAAVAQKIHTVVCVYANGEEESLAGGTFTYRIGYKGGNVDNPEKWLKAHL